MTHKNIVPHMGTWIETPQFRRKNSKGLKNNNDDME